MGAVTEVMSWECPSCPNLPVCNGRIKWIQCKSIPELFVVIMSHSFIDKYLAAHVSRWPMNGMVMLVQYHRSREYLYVLKNFTLYIFHWRNPRVEPLNEKSLIDKCNINVYKLFFKYLYNKWLQKKITEDIFLQTSRSQRYLHQTHQFKNYTPSFHQISSKKISDLKKNIKKTFLSPKQIYNYEKDPSKNFRKTFSFRDICNICCNSLT